MTDMLEITSETTMCLASQLEVCCEGKLDNAFPHSVKLYRFSWPCVPVLHQLLLSGALDDPGYHPIPWETRFHMTPSKPLFCPFANGRNLARHERVFYSFCASCVESRQYCRHRGCDSHDGRKTCYTGKQPRVNPFKQPRRPGQQLGKKRKQEWILKQRDQKSSTTSCQQCRRQVHARLLRECNRLERFERSMQRAPWPVFARSQELSEVFGIRERWVLSSAGAGGMAMRWTRVPELEEVWNGPRPSGYGYYDDYGLVADDGGGCPSADYCEYTSGYGYGYGNGAAYGRPDAVEWDQFDESTWHAIAKGWDAEDDTLSPWWNGPMGEQLAGACDEIAPVVLPRGEMPFWAVEDFFSMLREGMRRSEETPEPMSSWLYSTPPIPGTPVEIGARA